MNNQPSTTTDMPAAAAPPRRDRTWVVVAGALIVLGVVVGIAIGRATAPPGADVAASSVTPIAVAPAGLEVAVPTVVGMTGEAASRALGIAGMRDIRFAQNNAPMTALVLSQSPPGGTRQAPGDPVYVTLDRGPAAPVAAPASPPQGPLTTIRPGTYEVGTGPGQVAPGKYRSAGGSGMCYYARLKNNDGSVSDIIANDISQGQSLMTVKASDGYVEVTGCSFEKTD